MNNGFESGELDTDELDMGYIEREDEESTEDEFETCARCRNGCNFCLMLER